MKTNRTIRTILTMAGTLALAAGLIAGLTTTASASVSHKSPAVVFYSPKFSIKPWVPSVRPSTIDFGMGNSLSITGIIWSGYGVYYWGRNSAWGYGTYHVDNCKPDCASGHTTSTDGPISLYRVRTHDGHRYFTRIEITYDINNNLTDTIYVLGKYGPQL